MSRRASAGGILLDWFTVSYRSAGFTVAVLVVAAAAGFFAWQRLGQAPREDASEAISRATALLGRAEKLGEDERLDRIRIQARAALAEANTGFDEGRHEDARISALHSETLSRQAINMAGGDDSAKSARFYRTEGDVRVKRAGEFVWEAADGRMTLGQGDQVKTSSSASASLIYFDGTVTTIEPGSLLEVRDLFEDPVTKVRRVREKLNWGKLMASTQGSNVEGSYHEVATDTVAARTDQEGEFRVEYDKRDGTGSFDVFQGRIEVTTANKRENVNAGERIRSNAQGRLSRKQALPGVPRLLSPPHEKVYVDEDPTNIELNLAWEAVPKAQHYNLQISNQPLFADLLYDAERKETTASINGVEPADYYWRVRAILPEGIQGPFSSPRRFRVSSAVIRDRRDDTPPQLKVTEFVTVGPMLIINGTTEPGATLWIDHDKVEVSEDGSFYAVLRLKREGMNKVRFVAQDNAGNETKADRDVYIESY